MRLDMWLTLYKKMQKNKAKKKRQLTTGRPFYCLHIAKVYLQFAVQAVEEAVNTDWRHSPDSWRSDSLQSLALC